MYRKFYCLLLLVFGIQQLLSAQVDPYPAGKIAEELELRTVGPPSVPIICGDATVDFETVPVGETVSRQYQIRNVGESFLLIYGIELSGSEDFSVTHGFNFGEAQQPLAPGGTALITVHFIPSEPEEREATLLIYSSDSDENPCGVDFEGEGFIPQPGTLRIRREGGGYAPGCGTNVSYEFTDLPVGESETINFTLENAGDEPLIINNYVLSGSPDFTLTFDPLFPVPYSLAPGGELAFTVTFAPSSPGEQTTEFAIYTSETPKAPCTFGFEGGGLEPEGSHLEIINPNNGDRLNCGDTYYIDLYDQYPGPLLYGFYFTLRNYGTEDLQVSGTVRVVGVPGSEHIIDPFSVAPLEFIFLQTLVNLPGHQLTTLEYMLETNDPDQPVCTLYVEINQLPNKYQSTEPGGKVSIETVSAEMDSPKNSSLVLPGTSPTSITKGIAGQIRLYPTMSRERISLELPLGDARRYQIINPNGQVIRQELLREAGRHNIEISDLPAGMYWIKLEGYTSLLRFIKM